MEFGRDGPPIAVAGAGQPSTLPFPEERSDGASSTCWAQISFCCLQRPSEGLSPWRGKSFSFVCLNTVFPCSSVMLISLLSRDNSGLFLCLPFPMDQTESSLFPLACPLLPKKAEFLPGPHSRLHPFYPVSYRV